MGIKTKVTTALVLGAMSAVATFTSPALANNYNNQYANEMAMQMYAQNQQRAAYSPYAYGNYGLNGANALGNGAYLYGNQTRGGYGGGYGNAYGAGYGAYGRGGHHGHWWH
jgi:hypothetical protein